jgi:hypothetical protein
MSTKSGQTSNGVGFLSLLGLLFIGLKLAHVINWSWWWVLSPFWGGVALALVAFPLVFLFLLAKAVMGR